MMIGKAQKKKRKSKKEKKGKGKNGGPGCPSIGENWRYVKFE